MSAVIIRFLRINKEWFYRLGAAALPLLFTALWLSHNHQLPSSDATDYYGTAYKIYQQSLQQGIWYSLLHLERGWRPVFFPTLLVPFYFLGKGNAFFVYQGFALLAVFSSAFYLYCLLRLALNQLGALVAVNLLCLLPFFQVPILTFFSESALFPCLIAALYHLLQSQYFTNKKQTIAFTIATTLAISIRPVEAISHLFLIWTAFVYVGKRKHYFSAREIALLIAIATSILFLFIECIGLHFINHYPFQPIDGGPFDIHLAKIIHHLLLVVTCLLLMTWSLFAWINRKTNIHAPFSSSTLLRVGSSILLINFLWFAPFAFRTFLWVYRTSIGDIAQQSLTEPRAAIYLAVIHFIQQEGTFICLGTFIIACLTAILLLKQTIKVCTSAVFIYLALLIPISIWEVLFTVQVSSRKLSIAFPAAIACLLLVALQRGRFFYCRLFSVLILCLVQFWLALSVMMPEAIISKSLYPMPNTVVPNPHDVALKFMNIQAKRYALKNIALAVNVESALPVDPFLLRVMAQLTQSPLQLAYLYYSFFSQEAMQFLLQKSDAIFLADKKEEMEITEAAKQHYIKKFKEEKNQTLKGFYQLLIYYAQGNLQKLGFRVGPCLLFKAADHEEYQGCLLLKMPH